jgi:hypothetical protein
VNWHRTTEKVAHWSWVRSGDTASVCDEWHDFGLWSLAQVQALMREADVHVVAVAGEIASATARKLGAA